MRVVYRLNVNETSFMLPHASTFTVNKSVAHRLWTTSWKKNDNRIQRKNW